MRLAGLTFVLVSLSLAFPAAQRTGAKPRTRVSTAARCASDLGPGVKSRRDFCDVIIATTPADSISVTVPAHTGPATIRFDLHNRFTIPPLAGVSGALVFSRQEALVSLIRPSGSLIAHAAVVREFRSVRDLFDEIAGNERPGGVKAVAPGVPAAVELTIPAGISTVGIVGARLHVLTRAGEETFDTPGRPIAIVSNLRVEYRPGR